MIMFTPFRFLQVIAVTIALGGCATQKTAAVPGQDTGASAPQAATSPALPAELPSIRSGTSLANGGPLQQADGSLDPDIQAYAKEVASVRQVPLPHVEALLRSANYNATAVRLMRPSPHRIRRSWTTYRKRFVEPVRIRAGQQFWQDNQAFLDATAKEYGVPQSIIVAIIGVEPYMAATRAASGCSTPWPRSASATLTTAALNAVSYSATNWPT
jgi:membrane-bound lytic murein transglycosylase B